jgi:hypothetical protein
VKNDTGQMGQRVTKAVTNDITGDKTMTYYVRDAQGNFRKTSEV